VTVYVFDTEPIIAWLYDEPGHQRVHRLLERVRDGNDEGVIADVTAAEIVYLDARLLASARREPAPTTDEIAEGLYDVAMLERAGIRIEDTSWERAGRIKAPGGLSLGDAFAVAQAIDDEAVLVVGADDDFSDLQFDVETLRIREDPV